MALASEVLARAHEDATGPFPALSNVKVVSRFRRMDNQLHLLDMLRGLNETDLTSSRSKNAILLIGDDGELEIRFFRYATGALNALFQLEREKKSRDIVLVRADTSDEVRYAYRNYFSDARGFIDLVEQGCMRLAGKVNGTGKKKLRFKLEAHHTASSMEHLLRGSVAESLSWS